MTITIDKITRQMKEEAKKLLDIPTIDNLILSALGARICYSSDHPIKTLADERVQNVEERVKFLNRLAKAGHYSVFAHSPVTFYSGENICLYKLWRYKEGEGEYLYCANARHYIELKGSKVEDLISKSNNDVSMVCLWLGNKTEGHFLVNEASIVDKLDDDFGVLGIFVPSEPWDWMAFIAHNFSVIESHQHVRHTWQNFSQRSHRYTTSDKATLPHSFTKLPEKIKIRIDRHVSEAYDLYDELCQFVHKEDARYILPARSTTLMFSGPRFVIEDFIEKRLQPKAQHEIRLVAEYVRKLMKYYESIYKRYQK